MNLSLLSKDTGKPDLLPESLELPLRLTGEEKEKHDKKAAVKRKKTLSESQVSVFVSTAAHRANSMLVVKRRSYLTLCFIPAAARQ